MKVVGWICIALGALSLIGALSAVANGHERNIGGPIVFIVLGIFLISRAKKKDQEKQDFDNWKNQ
ncbi:MAG: hypothetical protein J6X86_00835 [Bacteroidales bacterium]|nr:hypothetical protein [Bacteroidales bacterium]